MFLKSIEMTGFKSFPDKIDLTFPRGITCVVGPNGSGKSNIYDALRWVMGEQSVKTLRGGKMEDVIFSGTLKRKPLGFCEVSLVVDNSDRALPMDIDEIVVTRRIFRSGECEYYINRSTCRLKDIHELFMDTGLGKDGYSLVGQGKIDEIISGRPQDRRSFFEEACGISKYHHKKTDAERKLLSTSDNITRINDITTELEARLEPLKLQSEKAKKYLLYKDELKNLEINLWLINYDKLNEKYAKAEDDYLEAGVALDKLKSLMEENDAASEEYAEKIKNFRERADALKQLVYNCEYDIKTFENQIEISNNNILHFENDIERIKNENKETEDKIRKIDIGCEISRESIGKMEVKKKEAADSLELLSSSLSEVMSLINDRNIKMAENKNTLAAKQNELINLNVRKNSFVSMNEALGERLAKLSESMEEKKKGISEFESKRKEAETRLDNIAEEEKENADLIKQYENEITALIHKSSEISEKCERLNNEHERISGRLDMLKEAENSYMAYPKGIKEVMEAELGGVKLHGTLASLIKTDPEYADAIDGALGGKLGNIVCDDENDAKKAIIYLKNNRAGRVTFLPVSSVKPKEQLRQDLRGEKGYIGLASELIRCDDKYRDIVEALLNQTAVFKDMDSAVNVSRKYHQSFKIATLGGEIFSKGGSVTGGELKVKGAMKRQAEIASLEEKKAEIPGKIEKYNSEKNKVEEEIKEKNLKLHGISDKKDDINSEKIKLISDIRYFNDLCVSYEKDFANMNFEKTDTESKIKANLKSISEIEEEYKKISAETAEFERRITAENSDMSEVFSKRDKILSETEAVRINIASIERDISYENDKISANADMRKELETELSSKLKQINMMKEQIADLRDECQFRKDQIEGLRETIEQYNKELETNKKDIEDAIKISEEKSGLSKKMREDYLKKSDETTRLEMKAEKLKENIDSIVSNLWDSYELTIMSANELKEEIEDIPAAEKRASELKHKIRSLGNVNLDSVEEYEEVNERYTFLTAQRDDLTEAKKELEKIIADMTSIMKKVFAEQFELIAKSFNETYIELFGGGRGALSLSDPDNVLESGIEIEVQPPGKKLTIISLLSGGEKAFAAIALLFSVIKIRPTPFCLFDEIEAALDDVNVYKYGEFLTKYKENTQFIVISHRRGTMESADTLYGVTMQEKGVSKLLKLDIGEIEELQKEKK